MKRLFSFVAALGTVLVASAQLTSISIEPVLVHDGQTPGLEALDGYTTYRIYANLTNPLDFVSAVYGTDTSPLSLQTTGDIFQASTGGNLGTGITPPLFGAFPELQYDSWFTIGASFTGDGEGTVTIISAPGSNAWVPFENGQSFTISDPFGASWFTTFPCAEPEDDPEFDLATCADGKIGFAGDDLKVLLAQITTDGDLSGIFNIQVFPNGVQVNQQYPGFTFSSDVGSQFGCMDSTDQFRRLRHH